MWVREQLERFIELSAHTRQYRAICSNEFGTITQNILINRRMNIILTFKFLMKTYERKELTAYIVSTRNVICLNFPSFDSILNFFRQSSANGFSHPKDPVELYS